MTLVERRQERGQLVDQARKINDKVLAEKRKFTAEEQTEWDRVNAEIDRVGVEISREERLATLERETNDPGRERAGRPQPGGDPNPEEQIPERFRGLYRQSSQEVRRRMEILNRPAHAAGFRGYLLDGTPGYASAPEARDLQMDVFTSGGAVVPPMQWSDSLIQAVDDLVFIRQWATKQTVIQAEALGVPSLDADPADSDWTSEIATGSTDTAMSFGRRELRPHPLAKRIKVSNKLLRASTLGVEALVRARLAYKFAISEEKALLTGSGAQQPLGVFTASADGIPTARDVLTGSATDVTADGLIDAKHFLKANYWPKLRWLLSREAIKRIRKLKDTTNQYLWQPGLGSGIPDRILETPYAMSEYVPAVFTTGLYVGAIGDFSFYWIADALDLTVQRLVELYAETNQTGYIGRLETDGAPVLAEAFARLKTN